MIPKPVRRLLLANLDRFQQPFLPRPTVLSVEESLLSVKSSRLSVARFGDGEMAIIRGYPISYQEHRPLLADRLTEVLQSNVPGFGVGIPDCFGSLLQYNQAARSFFKAEMGRSRRDWLTLLPTGKTYFNTMMSRLYIDWLDKESSGYWFELARSIWQDRSITIIEGRQSRLGVGNELFSNAKSIERILCPPKNAFDHYDQILAAAKNTNQDNLIIIALGPTAKLIAYDLHLLGYQAIDIGHIDIEYEWFLRQAQGRTLVPGKYVNEVKNGDDVEDFSDSEYEKQIIARL